MDKSPPRTSEISDKAAAIAQAAVSANVRPLSDAEIEQVSGGTEPLFIPSDGQ